MYKSSPVLVTHVLQHEPVELGPVLPVGLPAHREELLLPGGDGELVVRLVALRLSVHIGSNHEVRDFQVFLPRSH